MKKALGQTVQLCDLWVSDISKLNCGSVKGLFPWKEKKKTNVYSILITLPEYPL